MQKRKNEQDEETPAKGRRKWLELANGEVSRMLGEVPEEARVKDWEWLPAVSSTNAARTGDLIAVSYGQQAKLCKTIFLVEGNIEEGFVLHSVAGRARGFSASLKHGMLRHNSNGNQVDLWFVTEDSVD